MVILKLSGIILHRPCGLFMPRDLEGTTWSTKSINCFIGELGPGMAVNRHYKNLGPRLSIVSNEGKLLARLGGEDGPGLEIGKFMAPHGLAVDSRGDIYVGEVAYTNWSNSHGDTPRPDHIRTLQNRWRVILSFSSM